MKQLLLLYVINNKNEKKQTSKLVANVPSLDPSFYQPDIFIITDSKGNNLKPGLSGRLRPSLDIFSEKGATIKFNIKHKAIPSIQAATSSTSLLWSIEEI